MEYFFHYAIPPHDMGQESDAKQNGVLESRLNRFSVLLGAVFLFEVFQQLSVQQSVGRGSGAGSSFLNFCFSNRCEFTWVN